MKGIFTLILVMSQLFALRSQDIDFKAFHRHFSEVAFGLYASKFETSNAEYRAFIKDLKKQNKKDELMICRVDSSRWADALKYSKPYEQYYFQHEAYSDYPVVNITKEAARQYCKWLTEQYNRAPKRKYKRVRFRLPTEQEWRMAANAGQENALFPWGGPYLRNARGSYLANFRVIPQSAIRDREGEECLEYVPLNAMNRKRGIQSELGGLDGIITDPVKSFYPNEYGLYNMAGNVAEMVESKTRRTLGGSWQNTGYYLRLDAEDPYAEVEGPHPAIGFRVFMEIIEE